MEDYFFFISAASQDQDKADYLSNQLSRLYNVKPFHYKHNVSHRRWDDIRKDLLCKYEFILLIGTENTFKKREVVNEVTLYPKKVIILEYDGYDASQLPSHLQDLGENRSISFTDPYAFITLDRMLTKINSELAVRRLLTDINMPEHVSFFEQHKKLHDIIKLEASLEARTSMPAQDYGAVFHILKRALWKHDNSCHVMSITTESIRNFYGDKSQSRGEDWQGEQLKWIKERNKSKKDLKRIAILRNFNKSNPASENEKKLILLLKGLNDVCDLKIINLTSNNNHKNDLVPRDFGLFYSGKEVKFGIFTYISIFQGHNYTKFSGEEYHTVDPRVLEMFDEYFKKLWNDEGLTTASDAFKSEHLIEND